MRIHLTALLAAAAALPGLSQSPLPLPVPPKAAEPFAFADFSWQNGHCRQNESILESKYFTGEFRADMNAVYDFNHPVDHTLVGGGDGRTDEVQVQQLGIGGDFHWENVRGRVLTQFGMNSTMVPRNDPSTTNGQWDAQTAYRYVSEAYGGYHWDKLNGINLDAGIFMSYIGLFSFYNFDNWAYQPSYLSANTPWFFNGLRLQVYPSDKLKVEFWLTNGWQSYNMMNRSPGVGGVLEWHPNGSVVFIGNEYLIGRDTYGSPQTTRRHSDNSLEVKYYDHPNDFLSKMAFSFTLDLGDCNGGGVSRNGAGGTKEYFAGWMLYNRFWFNHDHEAITLGGGAITNPGRYLVLLPPINGANAATGTPYFTENPGDPFHAWDFTVTYDVMPNPFLTLRTEFGRRVASVPYFGGPGGVTPPGGNQGTPGSVVSGWAPDLVRGQSTLTAALMVKF